MIERTPRGKYRPVIMDFGLAREASDGRGLTESGAVMGTPAYMSPEQARGETRRLERRSDVYSLGATLYDILAGVPPFEDATVMNILLKVITDDPKPLREVMPGAPEALDTVVGKCLNKEPEQRYASALELADDLSRYLSNQRIVGKRLSLSYRIAYRARRNKPVAALMLTLLVCLLGFAGAAVRSRLATLRRERAAQVEAEQAQKLGRYVKDLEWLVRTAYSLPLHDTTPDKALVRERMAEIDAEIRGSSEAGLRLGHYVLGRGHLALHEWTQAYEHLKQAEALGHQDLELDYALGRVLGEKFSRALEDARKSGDKSFFEKRRKELEAEYLQPALTYLQKSRKLKTVSASYLEGLIDFYNQRYDAALINAHFAQRQIPWLYEAIQLEGDVHMARALDQKDHGDNIQAKQSFLVAITQYERAAQIGRSDHRIYEAIAEAWIRQAEMDQFAGTNPEEKIHRAIIASEQALEAAPIESYAYTKKAFSHLFVARYQQGLGNTKEMTAAITRLIEAGGQAIKLHPDDVYAYETLGIGYMMQGMLESSQGNPYEDHFNKSRIYFNLALSKNKLFPWAYNDIGISYMLDGSARMSKHLDPTEQFNTGIASYQKALAIDNEYYYAHDNLSYIYNNLSSWQIEHGQDPTYSIENAVQSMQKSKSKTYVSYWNVGSAYVSGAFYDYYSSKNDSKYPKLAIETFGKLFSANENLADAYADFTYAYYVKTLFLLRQKAEPTEAIEQGRKAVKKCHQVNNGDHYGCMAAEAMLLSLAGEAGSSAALDQSLALARSAKQHAEKDPNVLISVGEACLRGAETRGQLGQPGQNELKEGLAAVEQALVLAPGWPRALALHGALLLLRAKQQASLATRTPLLQEAQEAFAQAMSGNALLKNRFGGRQQEAAQLLAAAAKPSR